MVNRSGRRDASHPEPPPKKKKVESTKKDEVPNGNSAPKEIKKRRSTVKMPPTVMRTAGIEEATEPIAPKSRSEVLSKKRYFPLQFFSISLVNKK